MLLVYAGATRRTADPFVTLARNSTIKGVSFYYPEQTPTDIRPYPWTISVRGDRISVIDIAMANSYNALDCGTHYNAAHYLRNLNITALRRGVFVDRVYDIGRMENIHIHPSEWHSLGRFSHSDEEAFKKFVMANLEGFIIGKCDWSYMIDCFVIWAKIGFHFIPLHLEPGKDLGQAPFPNILITQSGSDMSPLAVMVEAVQDHAGIAFENCQFMNSIEINETNTGPVKLTNCGFLGPVPLGFRDPEQRHGRSLPDQLPLQRLGGPQHALPMGSGASVHRLRERLAADDLVRIQGLWAYAESPHPSWAECGLRCPLRQPRARRRQGKLSNQTAGDVQVLGNVVQS